jgi:hypothetical protein
MMRVRLWLTFYQYQYLGGPTRCFWRDLETEQAPSVGDTVIIYSCDEPDDGPIVEVKSRTWKTGGGIDISLRPFVIDPVESAVRENFNHIQHSGGPLFDVWSSQDSFGDQLLANGWVE